MIITPLIHVILTIEGKQKTISLVPVFPGSTIYNIIMDKQEHGQVRRTGDERWVPATFEGSPITDEYFDSLSNAIDNAIKMG